MNYQNMPKSPSEAYYALRASRALERAFQPITTDALARYIFPPSPRIPPKAFASSLVLHITHKITHSGLSDPRRAFLMPTIALKPRTESATVHLVLTPLEYVSGALVGVISAEGVSLDGSVMPFSEAMNSGIKRGQFVYDLKRKQVVSVMDDMGPNVLGVVATNWVDNTNHERVFFVIPKEQYSFEHMPKKALVVLTNLEYQISKLNKDGTSEYTSETPDKIFGEPEAFSGSRSANNLLQRMDAFDLSRMTDAIEDLARSMSGVYYGPNLKKDVIHPITGELSSRASGKMICRLRIPDYMGQCRIRRSVAQDYFLKLLPPGSERWFMQNANDADSGFLADEIRDEEEIDVWNDNDRRQSVKLDAIALAEIDAFESIIPDEDLMPYHVQLHEPDTSGTTRLSSASSGVPPLLGNMIPPYKGPAISVATPTVSTTPPQENSRDLSEEELKKRKDEERRIRNRLSAARSNEKRKEREREQRIELESLRGRIPVLENVRQQLLDENSKLKELAEEVL